MEKELEQIYNTLNDEQKQYVDAVIASDRSSKLLPLLRQFIHKNINEEELFFKLWQLI